MAANRSFSVIWRFNRPQNDGDNSSHTPAVHPEIESTQSGIP